MTIQFIEESTLTAMADAIRAGTGKTGSMLPSAMPTEIATIKDYSNSREGKYVWSVQSGDGTTIDNNVGTKYVASDDKTAYPSDGWVDGEYFKLVNKPEIKIVTWADGTDAEICAMVEAADAGEINLADYWAVGDIREVELSAMSATGVGESHSAQIVELVLMHVGEYKLYSAVASGRTTCSFVVGMKDCLAEPGCMINYDEALDFNEGAFRMGPWFDCSRRNWCNNVFKNAIPSTLFPIFKEFKAITAVTRNNTELLGGLAWFALPAEREVFGPGYGGDGEGRASTTEAASAELFQFSWYQTEENRNKNYGINGDEADWWERSPDCDDVDSFCCVYAQYASGMSGTEELGISPFGCI